MGDNVQFFLDNLFQKATVGSAVSGEDTVLNMLDNNPKKKYLSVGGYDARVEIIELELSYEVEIDEIFFKSNVKVGNITYWNGSAWTAFSTPATWALNVENQRFQFNAVSTSALRLYLVNTAIANSEKRVNMLVATKSDFELSVNPEKIEPVGIRNNESVRNERGLVLSNYTMGDETTEMRMSFRNLGSASSETDYTNLERLNETRKSFMVLLCGDTERDRWPYTNGDIKKMRIINKEVGRKLSAGVHSSGDTISYSMKEVQ